MTREQRSGASRRILIIEALALALAIFPVQASAHLVSTGLGPAYDGIYRFALTPAQVFPMAILALFAGRRGPVHARHIMFLLPLAWLAGCALPLPLSSRDVTLVPAFALLLTGGLLASDTAVPPGITSGAAIVVGVILGGAYGAPTGGPAGTLAAACFIFVVLALCASVSLPLRRMPAIVAVRVAGSWSAALGLLLVGWFVHGRT
jgi:urease accessory protein